MSSTSFYVLKYLYHAYKEMFHNKYALQITLNNMSKWIHFAFIHSNLDAWNISRIIIRHKNVFFYQNAKNSSCMSQKYIFLWSLHLNEWKVAFIDKRSCNISLLIEIVIVFAYNVWEKIKAINLIDMTSSSYWVSKNACQKPRSRVHTQKRFYFVCLC